MIPTRLVGLVARTAALPGEGTPPPARGRRKKDARLAATLLSVGLAACGPTRLAVIEPIPDPRVAASALIERTRLEEPLQVVFAWEAIDQGARARGRGVARVEPVSRARLDLFLENGETVLRAALVDGQVRLPVGAREDLLPPPDLMWAALGVAQPGGDATLRGGDRLEDGAVRLRYAYPDGSELHFETFHGVLRRIDLLRGGRIVEEVTLAFSEPGRYPTEAVYRHRAAFREMRLTRESLQAVDPFPAEIWDPSR